MSRKSLLAAALCLLCLPVRVAAQDWAPKVPSTLNAPLPNDPLKTTIHRLPNGLTVYLSPNHERPRVAARIAVRAGSKDDPPESTGMAHYLEHMLFKGTSSLGTLDYAQEKPHLDRILSLYEKRFKTADPAERAGIYQEIDAESIQASRHAIPQELDRVYSQLGFQDVNAHTSFEETVYESDFPANRAEAWAEVEAERFARPVFRLFQSELEAVYEEKNRSLDRAERVIHEAVREELYKTHPYGRSVLGTVEHLKNPSLAKMYEFYGRYYVPNNMALVLSGDFDREKMLEIIRRNFGAWQPKPLPAAQARPLPKPRGLERREVRYEAEEEVILAWPTTPARHADTDALFVMDMLMDNSTSGIINLTLNQAQKVKGAGSFPDQPLNEAGAWHLAAVPKQGQTLEEAEALLMEAVGRLKAGEFTDEDIKAVITNYEVGEKSRLESNAARAGLMADSFIHLEPWEETAGRLERLRRVGKADVLRVANKYLGPGRVAVYRRNGKPDIPKIEKPGFTQVDIDPSRRSRFADKILSLPAPPLEPRWLVEGRDYRTALLPSGRLYAARNPFNDLFSLTFSFARGSRHERALCAAFDLLDLAGAGTLSAEEYKKKLFSLGASVIYDCGQQESEVSLSGPDESLGPALKLVLARFEAPSVSTDTLKKMIAVKIGAHQDDKKDPARVAYALGEFARRGRESSVLNELSDRELRALTTEKLTGLIRGTFLYKRRTAYVGNRSPDELAKLLETGAGLKDPPAHIPLRFLKPARTTVYFTRRDMVQAQVGLFAADEVLDPEHAADYDYLSAYLDGGNSLIMQEIREARSLAYSAGGQYAGAAYKSDENQLWGKLACQADKTVEATALLARLLRSPPLDPERFQEAAKSIEEEYRANPVPFRAVPAALMAWEDEGLAGGDPRPERFRKALNYTLRDLERFARRFRDRPMTIYVLGPADRVDLPGLKKLGDFEEKTLEKIFPF